MKKELTAKVPQTSIMMPISLSSEDRILDSLNLSKIEPFSDTFFNEVSALDSMPMMKSQLIGRGTPARVPTS